MNLLTDSLNMSCSLVKMLLVPMSIIVAVWTAAGLGGSSKWSTSPSRARCLAAEEEQSLLTPALTTALPPLNILRLRCA